MTTETTEAAPAEFTPTAEAPYTAWGRAGDLILQNDLAAFVISAGYGSNGYLGEPGGLVDVHVVEDGERLPFEGLDELWPLINGAPVRADAAARIQAGRCDPHDPRTDGGASRSGLRELSSINRSARLCPRKLRRCGRLAHP